MRVLIADRNARLLESISRTFAHQFSIQTAATRERCEDLLRQGEFDLAIVCEKLADGPGLQLLGQIAQSSPDTLRIFAARRSRLELLKGRLGPFGLFRTLSYPIDAQKLRSALALARAAREIDPPATPGPAAVRPTVKRFSLVSADALFSINVPLTIASMRRSRPSESSRGPQLAPVARQASVRQSAQPLSAMAQSAAPPPAQASARSSSDRGMPRGIARASHATPPPAQASARSSSVQGSPRGTARASHATPPRLPSRSEAFERALARREAARRAASIQIASRPSRRGRKSAEASGGRNHSLARTPPLGSLSDIMLDTAAHPTHRPRSADATPKRSMVLLGATIVAVFLVATLALNRFDGAAEPSSSAQTTPTSSIGEQPVISAPPQNPTAASPMPSVRPVQSVAQRAKPKPDPEPELGDPDSQMAASNTPIADPSTFSSEAYEPIYPN
jgi:ActR/RegA family two-component response regulator